MPEPGCRKLDMDSVIVLSHEPVGSLIGLALVENRKVLR